MKDKPTKWGIKVFVLADAENGYVKRLQIYTGKNSALDAAARGATAYSEFGLCTRVVLELMDGLEVSSPRVYMDNYYSSPTLFLMLYNKGVNACGTARASRKYFPPELAVKKKDVDSGYYDYRSSGPLLACVWKDKRIIHFLTTLHVAVTSVACTVQRRGEDGTREDVECPPCLPDYQTYMRGVDRGDQLMCYYNIGRRSTKWWKRVFSYIVEVCALNACVLYKFAHTNRSSREDYLAFRISLGESLVGTFTSRSLSIGRPRSLEHQQLLRLDQSRQHFPECVAQEVRRDCVVCAEVGRRSHVPRSQSRSRTKFRCSVCKVFLCITHDRNCFLKYHTHTNYWI